MQPKFCHHFDKFVYECSEMTLPSPTPETHESLQLQKDQFAQKIIADLQIKIQDKDVKFEFMETSRNDSMKSTISKIQSSTKLLPFDAKKELTTSSVDSEESLSKDGVILLKGFSRDIQKLVSIVEIVKSQGNKKLYQYNRLLKYLTKVYPYQKKRKIEDTEDKGGDETKMKEGEAINVLNVAANELEEEKEKEKEKARQEIRGGKTYDLPVLYVILSLIDLKQHLDTTWTIQS